MMEQYKNLTICPLKVGRAEMIWLDRKCTMDDWYATQKDKPQWMMNLSLWDEKGPIGTVIRGGVMMRNSGNGLGVGVTKDGRLAVGSPWDQDWRDYVTAYPPMIAAGQLTGQTVDQYVQNAKTRRIAICGAGNTWYTASADALDIKTFAAQLLERGFFAALNYDGGGSARQYEGGRAINSPTDNRKIPVMLAVWDQNEKEEVEKVKYDVCLDAGHGVDTPGKCSPDGTYKEYEFNKDVALQIKKNLERCGLKVLLTNDGTDKDIPLAERCRLANDSNAKIVVSIHSNAAGNGWSDANYWMAAVIAKGGRAEKLAKAIEAASIPVLGIKSNGVQTQNLAMVRDTKAPAVLIEHGFHTCKTWVEMLKTQSVRAKIAECDAKGICNYLGVRWVDAPAAKWYEKELAEAVVAGITDGTRPEEPATRAEVAIMVLRALKGAK